MNLENLSQLPQLITMFSAFAAAVAAIASWRAANSARQSARAQIILDFTNRDADPDMGIATNLLWEFKRESSEDVGERFEQLLESDRSRWVEIDNARRIVHKFWLRLMSIKLAGLISEKDLITFVFKSHLRTILDILEPLEQKKPGAEFTRPAFDEYRLLYRNYDSLYKKVYHRNPAPSQE